MTVTVTTLQNEDQQYLAYI